MNAEHFIKFLKTFKNYVTAKRVCPELTTDRYPSEFERNRKFQKKTANENFVAHIKDMTENAKIFEVEDEQKRLLLLSDPPKTNDDVRLPFEHIFLDVAFTRDELIDVGITLPEDIYGIVGIGVTEGKLWDYKKEVHAGETIRFSVLIHDSKGYEFSTFADFYTLYEEYQNKSEDMTLNVTPKEVKKFVHRFFLSFINFVNNPEVELVEHCRSVKSRERREKKGLPVIPSTTTIRVTGKLKQYIDEATQGKGWTYNFRFWVRGHFRDLISSRYNEQKRIWILPYIKGKGLLVEKTYTVVEKNE